MKISKKHDSKKEGDHSSDALKIADTTIRRRKKADTTRFDRHRIPPKQNLFMMPAIWLICRIITLPYKLKIRKINMKGLKPPFIVLGTHHSFMDFIVTPLALFPHRANYVSELEGFEYYGEWLYRQIGCLGTRKFVNDMALVKNIKRVIKRNGILVLYPEARYANVGTNCALPSSLGKLIKHLDVPLVTLNMKGNYLQSPIWNLRPRRQARLRAVLKQSMTAKEIRNSTPDEINRIIEKELRYDEYSYQLENKIKIDVSFRSEGLEKALYMCRDCKKEFTMKTAGTDIFCTSCGSRYSMNEYGQLIPVNNKNSNKPVHIPDWYEWQRKQLHSEIESGNYHLDMKVHIEALPNAKNFIDMGEGRLVHSSKGFLLTFTGGTGSEKSELFFHSKSLFSVHTEYDYRGKGECITLSTPDNTYFIYPLEKGFSATKIQFAAEYFYNACRSYYVGVK